MTSSQKTWDLRGRGHYSTGSAIPQLEPRSSEGPKRRTRLAHGFVKKVLSWSRPLIYINFICNRKIKNNRHTLLSSKYSTVLLQFLTTGNPKLGTILVIFITYYKLSFQELVNCSPFVCIFMVIVLIKSSKCKNLLICMKEHHIMLSRFSVTD